MLRKAILIMAALGFAGAVSAGDLVDNGSFENGLTGWVQDGLGAFGTFESVANGGTHTFDCPAPAGFPGSGSFWSVSCQDDPDIHVMYQDIQIPNRGGVLQMVAGVDMCAVGGCGVPPKQWGDGQAGSASEGGFWRTDKGLVFACIPLGAPDPKGTGDDCIRIDLTDPAADVLDPNAGILMPIANAINSDATPSLSPPFELHAFAGQTVRLRFWVQASQSGVVSQADTISLEGRYGVPALQPLGLALLALVLGGVGLLARRRRRN